MSILDRSFSRRPRLIGPWRNPDFVKLWAAETVSLTGSQVTTLAWPITAAVVLRATPAQMGLQSVCWTSGAILAALLAGLWVDRLPRRRIMIGADLGRAALVASVPVAFVAGALSLGQLWAVVFLFSALSVLFDVANISLLPRILEREQLAGRNSALAASQSVVSMAGPGVAGPVVQALTAPFALLVDALSYCLSPILVQRIRATERIEEAHGQRPSLWREASAGFGLVLRSPLLRPLAASSATFLFFLQFFSTLRIWYLTRELGLGAGAIGLIAMSGGIAGFLSALLAAKAARRVGRGFIMAGGLVLSGIGGLMTPLAAGALPTVLAILALGTVLDGLGGPAYNINALSLRQAITPDRLLGRVNATMRFLAISATPIGAILAGVLGERFGVRAVLAAAAVGQALACLWIVFSPVWALSELPAGIVQGGIDD